MITGMDVLFGTALFFCSLGLAVVTVKLFTRNMKRELYPEPPHVEKSPIDIAIESLERIGSKTLDPGGGLITLAQMRHGRDLEVKRSNLAIIPPIVLSSAFYDHIARQNQNAAMMAQAQVNLQGSLYGITNMGGVLGPAGAPVVSNALAAAAIDGLGASTPGVPKDAPTAIVPHFLAKMNGAEVAAFVAQIEEQLASAEPDKKKGLERMLAVGRARDKEIMDAGRCDYTLNGLEPDNAAIREGIHPAHYHVWKLKKQVEG